mmetsp:Transcript_7809/g.6508  ORF Transcript_7809/g.6508 Transcript_7809/m.6508 type:complete len:101 (+) Transcript_7809:27-329(+)
MYSLSQDGLYSMNRGTCSNTLTVNLTQYGLKLFGSASAFGPQPGPPEGAQYWYNALQGVCPDINPHEGDLINITFQDEDTAVVYLEGKPLTLKRENELSL